MSRSYWTVGRPLNLAFMKQRSCHFKKSRQEIFFTAYPERSGWGGDDLAVSGRPGLDGPLDQPGEAVADEGGGAAIEPEHVLVEVGGEVLLARRAVVGAQEPALDEAEDEVDAGQPERGVAPGCAEVDGLVAVTGVRQTAVARPAVGGHGRGLGDMGGEEGSQALGRGIGHPREPEPAEAAAASRLAAASLDGAGDQGLAGRASARPAGLGSAEMGLVGLDAPGQGLAVGADHGLADLVQPGPGGLVAAQAQLPLELGGGDPALAGLTR